MIELSPKDLEQLDSKGISKEKVANQIETFKEGIPFVNLSQAAVVGNGILRFSEKSGWTSFNILRITGALWSC